MCLWERERSSNFNLESVSGAQRFSLALPSCPFQVVVALRKKNGIFQSKILKACKLRFIDPYFIVKLTFQAIICKLWHTHTQETKQLYIEIGKNLKKKTTEEEFIRISWEDFSCMMMNCVLSLWLEWLEDSFLLFPHLVCIIIE